MKIDTVSASTISASLSGNAGSAGTLKTAVTIGGVSFDGSASINLPGVNIEGTQSTTGNAATMTKLKTKRKIGGVEFDGTSDIDLPGVNTAGNQNISNNAATATLLLPPVLIGGEYFDASANIDLKGVNKAGDQDTTGNAATATKLKTAVTIGGVSFDGTANISLPGVDTTGNQDTTGNANDTTTAVNLSGGAINATTGTFSGIITSPSFRHLAYVVSAKTVVPSTQQITNGTSASIVYYQLPIPEFVKNNSASYSDTYWRIIIEYRWFGEIGPYDNENVMWDVNMYIGTPSWYRAGPYSARSTKSSTEIGNRNAGCTMHAINYWRDHNSTPEVVNLSCSFEVADFDSSDTIVAVYPVIRNNSGGTLTVATNRTIGNSDQSGYELGSTQLNVTFFRDTY